MSETKDHISVKDASKLIGYSIDHLRRLTREGKIRCTRFGNVIAIDRADLLRYKKEQDAKRGWITPEEGKST